MKEQSIDINCYKPYVFGDLFSEASRQVVISDGHEQPCSANDSVSDSSNIPLQGVVEVLSFIKECIFSPDWHSSIYKEACHQLNEERISALLRMLQPQLSVDERIAQRLGFLCSQIIAIRADSTLATKLESAVTDN